MWMPFRRGHGPGASMPQHLKRIVPERTAARRRLSAHKWAEMAPGGVERALRDPKVLREALAFVLDQLRHLA